MIDINPEMNTQKVTEMFAYVSVDEGGEGLCGFSDPLTGRWMPMVCTTRQNAELMKPIALQMTRLSGGKKTISLMKFKLESREEL